MAMGLSEMSLGSGRWQRSGARAAAGQPLPKRHDDHDDDGDIQLTD